MIFILIQHWMNVKVFPYFGKIAHRLTLLYIKVYHIISLHGEDAYQMYVQLSTMTKMPYLEYVSNNVIVMLSEYKIH